MNSDYLDNKILYELSTLHEWTDRHNASINTFSQAFKALSKSSYNWASSKVYHCFTNSSKEPGVSYDGEYLAVPVNNFIEIRDKKHLFEIYAQVDVEKVLQSSSSLKFIEWSNNSPHLAVCNDEDDIIVLDIQGNTIQRFPNLGLIVIQLHLKILDNGKFLMLILSKQGSLMTPVLFTSESIKNTDAFDFDYAVSQFILSKNEDEMLTCHKDSNGIAIKLWTLNVGNSESVRVTLKNSTFLKTRPKYLEGLLVEYPDILLCVEKSNQKYIAVVENSTKVMTILYIPSLTKAKVVNLCTVKESFGKDFVVDIAWWSLNVISILSSNGSVSLFSFKTLDLFEAETFKTPSKFLKAPDDSLYILEQSNGPHPQALSSLKQMMFWMKEDTDSPTVDLKLYQLLQTSPELLFYQKIEAHEFGDALVLAGRFNLDKDNVYKAQWSLNKCYTSAVYDFFYKITDELWVMEEIKQFAPSSIEMAHLLVDRGLTIVNNRLKKSSNNNGEKKEVELEDSEPWTGFHTYMCNCKMILVLYDEILENDTTMEFDGEFYKRMCEQDLVATSIAFATSGAWIALDVLFTKAEIRRVLEPYWLLIIAHLPETKNPNEYYDIIPEFVSKAYLGYQVDVSKSISSWYKFDGDGAEVGLWEETELPEEEIYRNVSQLPALKVPEVLTIPYKYKNVCGPLTTKSVFEWFIIRADEIVEVSGLFENAAAFLDIGIEKNIPLNLHRNILKIMENAVFSLHFKSITYGEVQEMVFSDMIPYLLQHVPVSDHVDKLVDVYLPFCRDISCPEAPMKSFIMEHVKRISTESLQPLIQTLEFKSEEITLLEPVYQLVFAVECLSVCALTKNWMQTAKEIGALLQNKLLQDKLKLGEYLLEHLGSLSPHLLFECFSNADTCTTIIRQLCQECLPKRDLLPFHHIAFLVDCEAFSSKSMFTVVFEEALKMAEVKIIQDLYECFYESYLAPLRWEEFLLTYASLYFNSSAEVGDKYIGLVRYLICTDYKGILHEFRQKIQVLDLLQIFDVAVVPRDLGKDRELLLKTAIFQNPSNYLKEDLLKDLADKLGVDSDYLYSVIAELAYLDTNYKYCKRILTTAIKLGCKNLVIPVCAKLLQNKDYKDVTFKEELFNHVIKYIPCSEIDNILYVYHGLPSYVTSRKRKLSDVCQEKETDMKILKVATDNRDMADVISDIDDLEELYTWLLGRSLRVTNTHVDKARDLTRVIEVAMEINTPDIKVLCNKISDILQANILKSSYDNINVPRFIYDVAYRRDTIMKLAERETLDLALSLGKKYSINIFDIYFRHYQWHILTSLQTPPASTTQYLLSQDREQFVALCEKQLYPKLDGKRYAMLTVYYQTLKDAGVASAQQHLAAVNKIRGAVPGLDYKALIESSAPLTLLAPLLLDGNVYVVAKMAPNIHLTSSSVFKAYCTKLLWKGEGKTQDQSYEERWERVARYRNQMETADWETFITEITCSFNPDLPYTLRERISREIPALNTHIRKLEGQFDEIKTSYIFKAYLTCYLQACDSPDIKHGAMLAVCFDCSLHQHLENVVWFFDIEKSPDQIIDDCIEFILKKISHQDDTVVIGVLKEVYWYTNEDGIALLERFIENVKNSGDVYIKHESIINKVKGICNGTSLTSTTVNSLVAVLEKYLNTEDDAVMIVYYKTNSITSRSWKLNVLMADILDHGLLRRLCEEASSFVQFKDLVEIIKLWSTVTITADWLVTYLSSLARSSLSVEECSALLKDVMRINDTVLSPTQITSTAGLFGEPSLSYLLVLSSAHPDLYYTVLTDITSRDLDNELLLDAVITREVYLDMVGTDLWNIIVRKIVSSQSTSYVYEISKKIQDMGYILEAASLLANFTASKYTTFSTYKALLCRK